ncbi:MAG: recombinase zinc beta ribbon domain-containing protein [Acidimicrobiales bacterium]
MWSPEPTHEPLVTRELFDAAAAVAAERQGSRHGANSNAAHPDTKRAYLLRSLVVCEACGRRMFGKTRRHYTYYSCQPGLNHVGKAAERFPEHPKSVWVRQDALLPGIAEFFTQRIFGARRKELLAADLGEVDHRAETARADSLAALRRALADIEVRQERLVRTLEAHDDPDGSVFSRVRDRLGELEAARRAKHDELAALRADQPGAAANDVDLLDELPFLNISLLDAPEEHLRLLFEGFRLQVRYDTHNHHANVEVTIVDDSLDTLDTDVIPLFADQGSRSGRATPRQTGYHPHVSHVLRAPSFTQYEPFPAGRRADSVSA